MLGLRMQEEKDFENFFTIVQNTAKKQENVFFCDDCLGDEFTLGNLEGDCMTGWLIPLDEAERFEKVYLANKINSKIWDNKYVLARWHINNGIVSITFE